MKVSCLPVSLFDEICSGRMSLPQWARRAKEIGYDGIDISIMFIKNRTPTYLDALKQELQEIGLPIVMMTTYPDFTNPDPVQREREYLYLQADIALASELHISYLRILAGQAHPGLDRVQGIAWVSDYFHRIAPLGKMYGVGLVFENHGKPGAWPHVDFTYDPTVFLDICRRIEDTDIRLNFDTGNITAFGGDPLEVVPSVVDRLETIHVTDMEQRGRFSPTVIGTGVTPNQPFFQYIKRHGFDNWLCIEEASGCGLAGIRDAYHYVKQAYNEA